MTQANAESAVIAINLQVGGVSTAYSNTVPAGNVMSQNPAANTVIAQETSIALVISGGPPPIVLPPDPATIAPPVDRTVATTVAASTAFLYTGNNPIQTGVAPGTIEIKRATVLRGQVNDRDGNPLFGITVTILNHPEFGQTLTRADGMFDMAVNGGGILTVNYNKTGYMSTQRQVNAPWNDYALLPDVVMLPFDPQVSTINLTSDAPIQAARGGVATDARGTRQATLFFSQGTTAQMVLPDGTTQPLISLNVRATEYTVGQNGPKAMPGDLPPTSAYTYAVELSVDEAVAAGATQVTFDRPVYFYVENFLNFPVGGAVPAGYYDYKKAAWTPSDNGKIVKILSVTGGFADLDTDGSGATANATKLAALGITDAERQQLATHYAPGQSLWRVPVTHFTPWDCNWPWGPPLDAVYPDQPQPEQDLPIKDPCTQGGSIIECQNQTLGESVSVTGTPFTLNYRSNRVPGRKTNQSLTISLSGAIIPASLSGIVLEVDVAGQKFSWNFPPQTNLKYHFIWDGFDCYGRSLQGVQPVKIRIGYTYDLVQYATPAAARQAFELVGDYNLSVNGREYYATAITYWQELSSTIENRDAIALGLGAWSLDIHHVFDPHGRKLYLGDGISRDAELKSPSGVITTVAGNGQAFQSIYDSLGDGGPATMAILNDIRDVAVGPDGSIFIVDGCRIRRVGPDGIINTVAGNGNSQVLYQTGIPAVNASGICPEKISIGPDGSIYFTNFGNNQVSQVRPDGILTMLLDYSSQISWLYWGYSSRMSLIEPWVARMSPDGGLYIAESGFDWSDQSPRIRRLGPDGKLTTAAGGYSYPGFGGDGGPATSATFYAPRDIAFGRDGSYYIADLYNGNIRRVGPDGVISTVAGKYGQGGDSSDFIPALRAKIAPSGLAIGPDGHIYIVSGGSNRIRRVGLDGSITTVAGNGQTGFGGDGGSATSAPLSPVGVAVGADGSIYIADAGNHRIRRVTSPPASSSDEFFIASEDGKEEYIFNGYGKHIRTVNARSNAALYLFGYDDSGRLTSVTDGNGNVTTIQLDSAGNPVAIVAPYGQRTVLTLDANGYINSITNPAGESTQMTYTADGLMTSFTDPKGNASQFSYDEDGLLTRDQNAAGGFSALSSTRSLNNSLVTLTTALNRTTTYLTKSLFNGDQQRTITLPTGAQTNQLIGANGIDQDIAPDNTITTTTKSPDPRFGMQAPLSSTTIKTPSGLTASIATRRMVSLADPNNLFVLSSQTDTLTFNGRTYTSQFNAAVNQSTTTTPAGRQASTLMDSQGRALSFTPDLTLAPLTFTYNTHGKLILAVQGNLRSSFGYDLLGRLASRSDALGNTIKYSYDNADRLTQLTLPSGRTYGFTYDANGNRTGITMPSGAVHNLGYTVINLGSDYTPPGNLPYAWQYSLDQEWTGTVLPSGRTVNAAYDSGGRPTGIVYPEAAVSLLYNDKTSRVSSLVRTPAGGGTAQQLAYTYDGSLVTGRTFSGVANGAFTYTYDTNFFLKQINLVSGSNTITTPITRDADGLVTGYGPFTFTRSGPAGAVSRISDPAMNVAVTYDSLGRVAGRIHTVNGQTVYAIQLTYDNRGNISRKVETVSGTPTTWDYIYDADGQLTAATMNGAPWEIYSYDVNGNRTGYQMPGPGGWTLGASFDAQDRIIQQGQTTYQFNADGQLTQRGSDTFQYSAQGELLQATVAGQTVTYAYDGMGRRVARTDSTGTYQYLYGNLAKPFQLTAMRDVAGGLSTFYYDDAGLMFAMDKNGSRFYIATDQLGTPKVVSDSTGTVVKVMTFDSFGFPTLDSNASFKLPVGFAGGLTDANTTGLVRFGYRDYEPATGRWTAKDPIFFKGGQGNLFQYVQNNSINRKDPSGLIDTLDSAYDYEVNPIIDTTGALDPNLASPYEELRTIALENLENKYINYAEDYGKGKLKDLAEDLIKKGLKNAPTAIRGCGKYVLKGIDFLFEPNSAY
ncbi:MAG TPA: RHS repeat-associated core domain-containing protein [Geobacteraceae bacterium]